MKNSFVKVIVFALVFVLGYQAPKFIYGAAKDGLYATLRNIPQRGVISDILSKDTLKVMPTYDKVMKAIQSDYYKDADEKKVTYSGIHGMLTAFHDPFSNFYEPDQYKKMKEDNEGNFSGIGAVLQMTEEGQILVHEIIKDAPADQSGIKQGDIIIAVDEKPTAGRDLESVVKDIRGEEGTKVKITIDRKGEHVICEPTRRIVHTINTTHKMLEDGIGYIKMSQFNQNSDREMDEALTDLEKNGLKGLIFDLRGNPGGLLDMAVNVSSRFVDKGVVVIIQSRGGIRQNLMVDNEKHNHKTYPLVVLVNSSSASASEIVSGCVKDHETATIVGTETFGKGLVQSLVPLQDGSAIAITTAKYLTPNGIDIHKKGIEPDYFVEQSEDYDMDDDNTDAQLIAGKKVLLNKMGMLGDDELKDIVAKSNELKAKYEEKLAKKEAEEAKNKDKDIED